MSRLSYRIFPGKNGGKDVKKSTISSHIFCKSPICVERCWDSAFQILSSNLQLRSQMENLLQPPNSPRLFWTRSLAVVKNLKLRWCFIREKNSFNSWTSLVSWLVWTTVPELIGAKVPSVLFGGKIEMYWCIWFMRCIWMFNDVYIHIYICVCIYLSMYMYIYIYKCFSIRFTQHLPICCFPPPQKKSLAGNQSKVSDCEDLKQCSLKNQWVSCLRIYSWLNPASGMLPSLKLTSSLKIGGHPKGNKDRLPTTNFQGIRYFQGG